MNEQLPVLTVEDLNREIEAIAAGELFLSPWPRKITDADTTPLEDCG